MSDDRVAGLVTYELLRTHGDLGNAETHKEILRALSSVPVDRESVQVLERFHATEYALLQVKALRATNDQVSKRRKQVREKWKGRQSVGLVKAATIQDVTQRFPKLFQGVMKDKMEHMVAVDEVKQRGKASLQTSAPVVATSPRVSTRGDLRSSTSRHAASFSMEKEAKAQNKAVLTDLVKKRPQPPHEDADMFNMNTRFKSPEQRNPFQTASERLLNDLMTSRSENMDVRRSKRRHGWREDSRIPPRGVYHPVNNDVLFGEGNKNEGCISSGGKKFISPVNSGIASKADAANIDVDPRLKSCDPELIEKIEMEIVDSGDPVTFDDIAGLQFAKKCVNELVIWPMHRPDIFTGLRSLPKGLLLFGPPGTGKTLIGKAIANQSGATFFNISASSLTSKWIGQGEKLVRTLFAVAAVKQPSVIFIDEIDSLLTQRSSEENESSRRMKTEFLVQLDGAGTKAKDIILVIGATNRPQELDEAARRRFVKRLYIPLPSLEARLDLVSRLLKGNKNDLTSEDIAFIAKATLGYSGADVRALCTEAAMGPIRNCSDIRTMRADSVRPISLEDFQLALRAVRSSVASKDLAFYKEWNEEFGSFAFENNEDS